MHYIIGITETMLPLWTLLTLKCMLSRSNMLLTYHTRKSHCDIKTNAFCLLFYRKDSPNQTTLPIWEKQSLYVSASGSACTGVYVTICYYTRWKTCYKCRSIERNCWLMLMSEFFYTRLNIIIPNNLENL